MGWLFIAIVIVFGIFAIYPNAGTWLKSLIVKSPVAPAAPTNPTPFDNARAAAVALVTQAETVWIADGKALADEAVSTTEAAITAFLTAHAAQQTTMPASITNTPTAIPAPVAETTK